MGILVWFGLVRSGLVCGSVDPGGGSRLGCMIRREYLKYSMVLGGRGLIKNRKI